MERRKYDREFKPEIPCLIEEGNQSIVQINGDFGIRVNLIHRVERIAHVLQVSVSEYSAF